MELLSFKKFENGQVNLVLDLSSSASASFLDNEERLALILNKVGLLSTAYLLEARSEERSRIEVNEQVYYQMGIQKKHRESLW
jgi:hypothetical protein